MTKDEKIDYTLLALYKSTKDGGMLSIIEAFNENNQELELEELKEIKYKLEIKQFAVFQVEKMDYRGQILDKGKEFVETTSFSDQNKSILELEE